LTRTTAVALSNFSFTEPMTSAFCSRVPISGLRRSTEDAQGIDLDPRPHGGAHGDGPDVLPLGRRGLRAQERVDEGLRVPEELLRLERPLAHRRVNDPRLLDAEL